ILKSTPIEWLKKTTYNNTNQMMSNADWKQLALTAITDNCRKTRQRLLATGPSDYRRVQSHLNALLETTVASQLNRSPNDIVAFAHPIQPWLCFELMKAEYSGIHPPISTNIAQTLNKHYGLSANKNTIPQHNNYQFNNLPNELNFDTGIITIASIGIAISSKPPIQKKLEQLRKRLFTPAEDDQVLATLLNKPHQSPDTPHAIQQLCSTALCGMVGVPEHPPLLTNVGLSAIHAVLIAAKKQQPTTVMMASTAYGGSVEQASIMNDMLGNITFQRYDIQTQSPLTAIHHQLQTPINNDNIIIMLEYPTNPSMKDTDLNQLNQLLLDYMTTTNKTVTLILDQTFCPIARANQAFNNDYPVVFLNSASKWLSGGQIIGGTAVANPVGKHIIDEAITIAKALGTTMQANKAAIIAAQLPSLPKRVSSAHTNAKQLMTAINDVFIEFEKPPVFFHATTKEQAKKGVSSATFSFNLHPVNHVKNNALAQHVVDKLTSQYPDLFEPCVSFGQGKLTKDSKVYITVPATSTQGAITEEDKQQQAINGVQLIRFSAPPKMNHLAVKHAIQQVLIDTYRASNTTDRSG
ncbi:MAG: PLP-dependent transferase, partial [Candidatus Marinamargulisbacteria bacterium]